MRELLTSEVFLTVDERRVRPKSPAELVVGMVRSLGIETDASGLPVLMTRMGQTLFDPPNVAGWPGSAWINSSTLLERINFANRVATDRKSFNPQADLAKVGGTSPREIVDYFIDLLLDRNTTPSERQVLYDRARDFLNTGNADAAARAVVYLVLSSPDYQLV
ncbi:MAG: hypothetical protein HW414_410 [Dehalococcoidia bacterium]|nr:hypothetical protein [Dehalococcoidia bacterium]